MAYRNALKLRLIRQPQQHMKPGCLSRCYSHHLFCLYKPNTSSSSSWSSLSLPYISLYFSISSYSSTSTLLSSSSSSSSSSSKNQGKKLEGLELQKEISKLATKVPTLVSMKELIRLGKRKSESAPLVSAKYLRRELPIRLAHRLVDLQSLPYIVGCNPYVKRVYELQIQAFTALVNFTEVIDTESEKKFAAVLQNLVDENENIVDLLAKGVQGCKKHMSKNALNNFLRQTLKSRIGIRLICEHYLALRIQNSGYIGIIYEEMSPKLAIEKCGDTVSRICQHNFGVSVPIEIDGHLDTKFPYIPRTFEYIFIELLKNSMRATVEFNMSQKEEYLPPIKVTICKGASDVTIRISDRGGGISPKNLSHIWDYSFTTVEEKPSLSSFDGMMIGEGDPAGVMAGLGFGLPMARIYAEYFGGSINLYSLEGYGCDIYITLNHLGDQEEAYEV